MLYHAWPSSLVFFAKYYEEITPVLKIAPMGSSLYPTPPIFIHCVMFVLLCYSGEIVEHSFEARKGMNVVLLNAMWVL